MKNFPTFADVITNQKLNQMKKKHILTKTITVTFEWEDADREVGIMEGAFILTDIIDADTKKQLDFSLNVYEELTEQLTK